MAIDLLGETLDIHCGGIDLIFPHHEDEIAQSEAATGKTFSRFWCHGAFLLTEGTKMAKRVGNVTTVAGYARGGRVGGGGSPLRVQHPLSEGAEPLRGGARGFDQGGAPGWGFRRAAGDRRGGERRSWRRRRRRRWRRWRQRCSTISTRPNALAGLFTFISRANAELDRKGEDTAASADAQWAFTRINGVLDIVPDRRVDDPELVTWVEERLSARRAARERRDFGEADRIRAELTERGIGIEDGPRGTKWKRVR